MRVGVQLARFLVAAEPSIGLDSAQGLTLFARMSASRCVTIVALDHLSLAARYCHRVLRLKGGTALAEGLPQSVLVRERLAKAYGFRTTVVQIDDWLGVSPSSQLHDTIYGYGFVSRAERGVGGSTEG
ncbi:MAG: hypothetical protein V3U85_02280 [Hyphomicrobium sp.]